MKSKHTPGPWESDAFGLISGPLDTRDTGYLASVNNPARRHNTTFKGMSLYETDAMAQANAHIIKAAPVMYEALRECEAFISGLRMANLVGQYGIDTDYRLERVKAALAQAEGKE
jgi:hypothetical protein